MSFCTVRVLQIQIEADIGDGVLGPVVEKAMKEYFNHVQDEGAGQDDTFTCSDGVKVTASHYYRNEISK